MLIIPHLLTSTKRQTHTSSFGTSKSTGIVGRNLRSAARVGQIARVVHGVTIGNVVLGTRARGIAARLVILNAAGD
jgi:hypothetical protein